MWAFSIQLQRYKHCCGHMHNGCTICWTSLERVLCMFTSHTFPNMYQNRTLDVPTVYRNCSAYVPKLHRQNCHVPNATSFVLKLTCTEIVHPLSQKCRVPIWTLPSVSTVCWWFVYARSVCSVAVMRACCHRHPTVQSAVRSCGLFLVTPGLTAANDEDDGGWLPALLLLVLLARTRQSAAAFDGCGCRLNFR